VACSFLGESASWSNLKTSLGAPAVDWAQGVLEQPYLRRCGLTTVGTTCPWWAGEVRRSWPQRPACIDYRHAGCACGLWFSQLGVPLCTPFNEVVTSNSTAYGNAPQWRPKQCRPFLGRWGTKFVVCCFFLVSTMGGLHSVILVKARIPFAMARDGLFLLANWFREQWRTCASVGDRHECSVGQCAGGYRNL